MNSLLSIGPLGLGYQLMVDEMPAEDNGCFANSYQRTIVWDAPLVALACAKSYRTSLISNKIGTAADAINIRRTLKDATIEHREIGIEAEHTPADFVISAVNKATRTWVSTITPPTIIDIRSALGSATANVLYSDHWIELDELPQYIDMLCETQPSIFWYNVGDWDEVAQLPFICDRFKDAPGATVVQVSLKTAVETSLLRTLLSTFVAPIDVRLIVTRGGGDIIVKFGENLQLLPVRRIVGKETTGAGAHLTSSFLRRIAETCELPASIQEFSEIVGEARDFATRCIENGATPVGMVE